MTREEYLALETEARKRPPTHGTAGSRAVERGLRGYDPRGLAVVRGQLEIEVLDRGPACRALVTRRCRPAHGHARRRHGACRAQCPGPDRAVRARRRSPSPGCGIPGSRGHHGRPTESAVASAHGRQFHTASSPCPATSKSRAVPRWSSGSTMRRPTRRGSNCCRPTVRSRSSCR